MSIWWQIERPSAAMSTSFATSSTCAGRRTTSIALSYAKLCESEQVVRSKAPLDRAQTSGPIPIHKRNSDPAWGTDWDRIRSLLDDAIKDKLKPEYFDKLGVT